MTARKKWSAEVTKHSDAMDLEEHIFESDDAKKIANSLKRSAEHSHRRKAEPFQSAMSMLNFYINRAGSNLPEQRRRCWRRRRTSCVSPSAAKSRISYRDRITSSVLASSLRTALRAASGRCRRMFLSIDSCSFWAC